MQPGVKARYDLKPDALSWLASLSDELLNSRKKPAQDEIARRAGLNPVSLSKAMNGRTRRLGEPVMSGLVNLAIEYGATRRQAEDRLFDFLTADAVLAESAAAA